MTNNRLALRVALRYLWSRKSHSAVTAIAIAGVCGVAIATMAIVCVLSVFNGFNEVIIDRDTRIMSDLTVTPASGGLISNADSLAERVGKVKGVDCVTPVVKDEAVAYFHGRQLPVSLLGVKPDEYRHITSIDSTMISGRWKPQPQQIVTAEEATENSGEQLAEIEYVAAEEFDESALFDTDAVSIATEDTDSLPISPIIISQGAAANLGIPSGIDTGLMVFLPRRTGSAAFADPTSAFMVDSLCVTGVFSSGQAEFDANTVITDLEVTRRLLEYDTQANALYIKVKPGSDLNAIATRLAATVGKDYKVNTRSEQQTLQFRMVAIEKWITFLLLSFILLIASFNIISTLSMLIVEKRSNIHTMRDYGASRTFLGRIFLWESIIVCLSGSLSGMTAGVVLCLLQMQFGFITVPGDPSMMTISSYPVSVSGMDLLLIFTLSVAVAILTGLISAAFASRTAARNFK